jgi:hypothetical protein
VCIAIGAQREGMARTISTPTKSRRCLSLSSSFFTTLNTRGLEEHHRPELEFVRKASLSSNKVSIWLSLTRIRVRHLLLNSALTDGRHRAFTIDPPIKQEASYSGTSGSSQAIMATASRSQKRRRHDESQDIGEKRQRIASGSSASRSAEPLSEEFREMLAQIEEGVMQQHAPSAKKLQTSGEPAELACPVGTQYEHIEPAGQSGGFMSDPHLYMRILSLPILESLVGTSVPDKSDEC